MFKATLNNISAIIYWHKNRSTQRKTRTFSMSKQTCFYSGHLTTRKSDYTQTFV